MTNAQKFDEVFGFKLYEYPYLCDYLRCNNCPFDRSTDECGERARQFWNEEYKGGRR